MNFPLLAWRQHWQRRLRGWQRALDDLLPWRAGRLALWLALIGLVLLLLGTLVWLAGRYEASQVQAEMERDTQDAVSDLRTGLSRDVQALQGVLSTSASERSRQEALQALLRDKREWLRVERRDPQWQLQDAEDSPLRAPAFERTPRSESLSEMMRSCLRARQFNGPAYSSSYYLPMSDGLGMEVMELCMPMMSGGRLNGYLVVVYSLQELLVERLGHTFARRNLVSFTEADGTRLAMAGSDRRGQRLFTAQQLLDLPGNTLVLRMDGRRSAPDLFPNVLTALVTAMSIALITVVVLLVRDSRRRPEGRARTGRRPGFSQGITDCP